MKQHYTLYILLLLVVCNAPVNSVLAQLDLGKSYINVTKGSQGGTVETGDILEIRASFVVRGGTYDSCAFYDVVPANTTYIPGTIRVLTNEGKVYKQLTDARADDEGWIATTNIRINLGYTQNSAPARWYRRGRVVANNVPRFGGSCLMVASYRVRVDGGVGTVINVGGGQVSYITSGLTRVAIVGFPNNLIAVYRNYGICSNTIGANSLGTEFNGSFGSGKNRNRGTSANVPPGYTYNMFTTSSPQDYYYGIANNTSTQNYSTHNNWPKPDVAPSHRVFNLWDIIGDHTGAVNPTAGNPPADTVANANGGYMLVINAAYRIDSAFQQTISGLCPNTYYEISCWMRNICSRCGSDSLGRGAGVSGYIPSAPNDSSGVNPNLSFEVNGVDYYSSGNLAYNGQWVKKGFTYLTGPTETSFTLKFFNNAPGGGGNDWALDDISVSTCSPNLELTPSENPTICLGNAVDMSCIVRSYFDNYTQYKWQRSTDKGLTWMDTGNEGTGSPAWNGTEWEYKVNYPPYVSTKADSGIKYRIVIATTYANLNSPNCAFSAQGSAITLNVIDCGAALSTDILSFTGRREQYTDMLSWTSTRETEPIDYIIERSADKRSFSYAGVVRGNNNGTSELNVYNWRQQIAGSESWTYRIKMVNNKGAIKYSRQVTLKPEVEVEKVNLSNPFYEKLQVTLERHAGGPVHIQLLDESGRLVRSSQVVLAAGTHTLTIPNTSNLLWVCTRFT